MNNDHLAQKKRLYYGSGKEYCPCTCNLIHLCLLCSLLQEFMLSVLWHKSSMIPLISTQKNLKAKAFIY